MSLVAIKRHRITEQLALYLLEEVEESKLETSIGSTMKTFLEEAIKSLNEVDFQKALLNTRQVVDACLLLIEKQLNIGKSNASFADRMASIVQLAPTTLVFGENVNLPYGHGHHLQVIAALNSLRKHGNSAAHQPTSKADENLVQLLDSLCQVKLLITAFSSFRGFTNRQKSAGKSPVPREMSAKKEYANKKESNGKKGSPSNKQSVPGQKPGAKASRSQEPYSQCDKKHHQLEILKLKESKLPKNQVKVVWRKPASAANPGIDFMQCSLNKVQLAKTKSRVLALDLDKSQTNALSIRYQCVCKEWSEWCPEYVRQVAQSGHKSVQQLQTENKPDQSISSDEEQEEEDEDEEDLELENQGDSELEEVLEQPAVIVNQVAAQVQAVQLVNQVNEEPVEPKFKYPPGSFYIVSKLDGKVIYAINGLLYMTSQVANKLDQLWIVVDRDILQNCAFKDVAVDVSGYSSMQAIYKTQFDLILYARKQSDNLNQRWKFVRLPAFYIIQSQVGEYVLSCESSKVIAQSYNSSALFQQWDIVKAKE